MDTAAATVVGFFEETPFEDDLTEEKEELPVSNGVKDFLIEAWKAIDDGKEGEVKEYQTFSFQGEASVKTNTFFDQLTKEEEEIVKQRIAQQQKMYQDFEKREKEKIGNKIQAILPHVTPNEAVWALKECNGDEEEVCVYLTDNFNLHQIRKKIAKANEEEEKATKEKNEEENESEDEDRFLTRKRRRSTPSKSRRSGDVKGTHVYRKLRLDDALAQGNFEGWSEARIRAYKQKDVNPNAYYYRFNDPGEPQRNGKWTKSEIKLFYKRMEEVGVNGQWGVFSQTIPGRVGYQCSNFYRQLIECGAIKDENYVVDEKGKAHFLFKGKRANGEKSGEIITRTKRKRTRRKKDDEGGMDTDDDEYRPGGSWQRKTDEELQEEKEDTEAAANPLPGLIDPITLCEVERPAISPFGHVLSYTTWSRCLSQEPRNICPFTKNTLKKRDLVILTWDNIEQYRNQIVDIQKQ